MNKKSIFIMSFIAVLVFACGINAAVKTTTFAGEAGISEQWTPLGFGAGQTWDNPEHWFRDILPSTTEKAKVDRYPGPVVNTTVDVNQLFISQGNDDDATNGGKMTGSRGYIYYAPCVLKVVSPGFVNVRNALLAGYYCADNGTIQVDSGAVDANVLTLGAEGTGTLIMNGGTVDANTLHIAQQGGTGRVQISAGTLTIKQITYEFPYKAVGNGWLGGAITDPCIALPQGRGKASIDISGNGLIVHKKQGNIANFYENMVKNGKLTANGGKGSAYVRFAADTNQVTIVAKPTLWKYSDITVTSKATMDNDANRGIDLMFRTNIYDPNAATFLSSGSAGTVYDVNWTTATPVTVNSIEMVATRDTAARAISHFTLKYKSGSSYVIVPGCDVTVSSANYNDANTYTLNVTLGTAITAKDFRAEFTGADIYGPRIRELQAFGTRAEEAMFNYGDLIIANNSPVIADSLNPTFFGLPNMFEPGYGDTVGDVGATTFNERATGYGSVGSVYFVEFLTKVPVKISSCQLIAEHDATTNLRAIKHFTLKAKSISSPTYDKMLYDADVTVPYSSTNILTLNIAVSPLLTTQAFRAEFTANDANGPRIRELNCIGTKVGQQLWEPTDIIIGDHTTTDVRQHQLDMINAFQEDALTPDPNYTAAIFYDKITGSAANFVDYAEWKTRSDVQITNVQLISSHGPETPLTPATSWSRAMKHFKLLAKGVGSPTYNLTLYDADIAVPYDHNSLNLNITLAPISTHEFRAEFTCYADNGAGTAGSGVRVTELNAGGYKLPSYAVGNFNGDSIIDNKDLRTLTAVSGNWLVDNSGTGGATTPLDTFEYTSYPTLWSNTGWSPMLLYSTTYYPGLFPSTSPIHGGARSMDFNYYVFDPGYAVGDHHSAAMYIVPSPFVLKNYSQISVWLNRKSGNSFENYLALRFVWPKLSGATVEDDVSLTREQATAFILSAQGSTQTPSASWSQWVINLDTDLTFQDPTIKSLADTGTVGALVLEACDRLNFIGGSGDIYVDDLTLTSKCTSPAGDLNSDCKVNFKDFSIFGQNWLAK